jgi:hypothetical protein
MEIMDREFTDICTEDMFNLEWHSLFIPRTNSYRSCDRSGMHTYNADKYSPKLIAVGKEEIYIKTKGSCSQLHVCILKKRV